MVDVPTDELLLPPRLAALFVTWVSSIVPIPAAILVGLQSVSP